MFHTRDFSSVLNSYVWNMSDTYADGVKVMSGWVSSSSFAPDYGLCECVWIGDWPSSPWCWSVREKSNYFTGWVGACMMTHYFPLFCFPNDPLAHYSSGLVWTVWRWMEFANSRTSSPSLPTYDTAEAFCTHTNKQNKNVGKFCTPPTPKLASHKCWCTGCCCLERRGTLKCIIFFSPARLVYQCRFKRSSS